MKQPIELFNTEDGNTAVPQAIKAAVFSVVASEGVTGNKLSDNELVEFFNSLEEELREGFSAEDFVSLVNDSRSGGRSAHHEAEAEEKSGEKAEAEDKG